MIIRSKVAFVPDMVGLEYGATFAIKLQFAFGKEIILANFSETFCQPLDFYHKFGFLRNFDLFFTKLAYTYKSLRYFFFQKIVII